ncbi:MAG: glycosyltransferase family 4 protein [Methanosarcina sp.]
MKVLVLTSSFPRFIGDVSSHFVYDFSEGLKKSNHDVFVLAPHHTSAKKKELMNGLIVTRFKYFFPSHLQKFAYGGGVAYNLKNSLLAKIQIPFFFVFELLSTINILRKENIDIINSHWFIPQGLTGAICKKFFSVSHVVIIHSSEITLLKKIPFRSKIVEFILLNTDFVVSVSKHRVEELLSFVDPNIHQDARKKIQIIPMGVEVNTAYIKVADKCKLKEKYGLTSKHVLLFVGRLVEVKGCEYLIRSLNLVVKTYSDVTLLIVGDGPLLTYLQKIVDDCGLSKFVRFEGFIEHKKIIDYYNMSDIVIVPSIVDSSGFQEGLPVVLLEALTLGKPVVSTKTKGAIEVIKNNYNGVLVDQKDSVQVGEAMLKLLDNEEFRDKLSYNASQSGKIYNWNVVVEKYVNLFTRCTQL